MKGLGFLLSYQAPVVVCRHYSHPWSHILFCIISTNCFVSFLPLQFCSVALPGCAAFRVILGFNTGDGNLGAPARGRWEDFSQVEGMLFSLELVLQPQPVVGNSAPIPCEWYKRT